MRSIDVGFRVTTSQDEIRDFIRSTPGPQIIFSTYHSSEKVANAALEEGVTFDLVICDEAHWLAGRVGKSYTNVLGEKLFPAHKRLFMTATPKVFSAAAKKTASNEGCLVSSMDDAAKFGAIAHQLPFALAIKGGLLTDYRVVVAVTTNVEAKKLLAEKRFVSLDGTTMTANDLAAVLAVAKAAERYNLTRVISFHSSIKRSKGFVDAIKKVCSENLPGIPQSIDAAHVDGSVSATERLRRLDHLKAGTSDLNLLANARCLTEGIDVPSLDGVAFVDPRQSEVDITQAVGRAIRPSPNKKMGTIIIPVVMSDKEAAEGKLDASSHKKIRQVLWALRAHDSEIAIAIDDFVFCQASHTSGSRDMIMPEKIVIEFDGEKLKEFAENIRICILKIGSPDTEWAEQYSALKAFLDAHKRWPTQRANGEEGLRAVWVNNQRQGFKKSTLSPERVKRLEELPGWSWDSLADIWDQTFTAVQIFHGKNKRWPAQKTTTEEAALAQWIGHQRRAHKKNILSPERVKRLEELPDWSWDPHADTWDQNFVAAEIFHDKHKRWPTHGAAGEEGALAQWASAQRHAFKKSTLSSARIKRLEGLPGWSWDPHADTWDQNFVAAEIFHDKHKRWPKIGAAGEEGALAHWASAQRHAFKKSTLSSARIKRLEGLPGWSWDAIAYIWDQRFEEVGTFCSAHGRWPTHGVAGEEGVLAKWVSTQRRVQNKGLLSPERTLRLNSIPGWSWDAFTDKWNRNFAAVQVFHDKYKRWPEQRAAGEEAMLARWVSTQRKAFKKSSLSPERTTRLNSISGWTWSATEQSADCVLKVSAPNR
jgi:superfamily II DNA/RNA helicase